MRAFCSRICAGRIRFGGHSSGMRLDISEHRRANDPASLGPTNRAAASPESSPAPVKRPGDCDALWLAAGELGRPVPATVAKPEQAQQLERATALCGTLRRQSNGAGSRPGRHELLQTVDGRRPHPCSTINV